MKKHKLKKKDVWYVGDIGQDARVSRKAGCTSVILASRFAWNPIKQVMEEKPDIVVKNLEEIKKRID